MGLSDKTENSAVHISKFKIIYQGKTYKKEIKAGSKDFQLKKSFIFNLSLLPDSAQMMLHILQGM